MSNDSETHMRVYRLNKQTRMSCVLIVHGFGLFHLSEIHMNKASLEIAIVCGHLLIN